ncbi:MAG: SDR family NAD(P)-dependent oxidoreductase [Ilumatobacteraceae bacterium]
MNIDGIAAVTGAGAGLGLGITKALAQRGFDVLALVYEESHAEAVENAVVDAAGGARVHVLDVTRLDGFTLPDDLQVLVNNAGVRLSSRPIEAIDAAEWRRTMDVNFFGLVDLTRLALPIMRTARRGVICNVSSGSLFAPTPFLGAYRASKAAISAFSETLRIEVAQFGIRVVEIMPGAMRTGMNVNSILNKIADTSACPAYLPMAQAQRAMFEAIEVPHATVDEAGRWVADAILDDTGPQRYGSDPHSQRSLERWRTTSDEVIAGEVLATYAGVVRSEP